MTRLLSDSRGTSLVELLLVALVSTILLVGVSSLVVQGQEVYGRESSAIDVRQSTRIPLTRMSREIRLAGFEIANLPQAVLRASANSLAIAADLDDGDPGGDCATEDGTAGVEGVYYQLREGLLQRSVRCWDGSEWQAGTPASPVMENVQTQRMFRYFAADGTEIMSTGSALAAEQRDLIASIVLEMDVTDMAPGVSTTGTYPDGGPVYGVPRAGQKGPRAAVRTRVVLRNRGIDPTPTKSLP